jgi:hypothetical protein
MKPDPYNGGEDAIRTPIELSSAVEYAVREVKRQDEIHPDGFPATRDGLRLGLAALQDELREAEEAWRADRRRPEGCPWINYGGDHSTEAELLQIVGIGLRMLRSIHASAGPSRGE